MSYEEYVKKVFSLKRGEASHFHKLNWNKEFYLKYCFQYGKPKDRIISVFLEEKRVPIDNYEQAIFFFNRYNRIAKELEGFPIDRIRKVIQYLVKNAEYKFTLETVGKYLEMDISETQDEEAIMILGSGEKVYTIERLQELEKLGKIEYIKNKWTEK